ncbi:hypothetical protein GCM10027449_24610 [Sinomonas notoginsengisoli]
MVQAEGLAEEYVAPMGLGLGEPLDIDGPGLGLGEGGGAQWLLPGLMVGREGAAPGGKREFLQSCDSPLLGRQHRRRPPSSIMER